ncbi:hypothetical protein [Corynebacterium aquatimens]|uniref:hypothetical protein n=1 Tax=Corynebacterium aquatimens TaxID=1190508 RepID=UPI0033138867
MAGNRHYRIIWRIARSEQHDAIIEIAEVWAAGARSDGEIYQEMQKRVEAVKLNGAPETRPLVEVIEEMGQLYLDMRSHAEPPPQLPEWLKQALKEQLQLSAAQIAGLTQEKAQKLLAEHWSRPK